ncbi:sugar ABC transporter ATP-binding protein [Hydrogenoanaerobacterium sp.]|uniref:sugar ABC transporter ATP-binding protein n=1 Tax=Hydrogenoanaerobacterium sp. TaxID=2953763 RepID=UPI0028A2C111|nr:sugar ABC transporter ATP-binding protein [Hydrogenoanaerobacterium sp.]
MSSSLEFRGITKAFPGVLALDHVSFKANGGEVVALVGENGAGKSTLLKVLNGDYQPDEGQYLIDGEERHFKVPQEAIAAGVSIIYQERQIIPYLSVAENIFMEEIPVGNARLIDYKTLNAKAQAVIDEFKLPIHATERVKDLSVAYQQMVEIMKAYRRNPKIIAFDEPTASLSDAEIETLFQIIDSLKQKGIIILYVSHRMKEIFQITDQVVILKDGKFVEQIATKETDELEIVKKMVGRNLGDIFLSLDRNDHIGETVLEVKNLVADNVKNVSFKLHAGEVLGFAGLVGAGRTETMRAIFGADKRKSGEILMEGKPLEIAFPEDAIQHGIALCPEDRKDQGIVARRSIKDNISIAVLPSLVKNGFLDFQQEKQLAHDGVKDLNVKTPSIEKPIGELSGGNQQKVILARWLAAHPKVLILDEPTKGIDVGSKSEIYQIICNLAKQGIGIIVISSELPEVMGICDRLIVMCQGRITGELMREEATDKKVLMLAMADMLGGKAE